MGANFICDICGKVYSRNFSLNRHIRMHHHQGYSLRCTTCNINFSSKQDYLKHIHLIEHQNNQKEEIIHCKECKEDVVRKLWIYHQRTNKHKDNCLKIVDEINNIKCLDACFNNRITTFRFKNNNMDNLNPELFFNNIKDNVACVLKDHLQKHTSLKFNFELLCEYMKMKDDEEPIITIILHQTKMHILSLTNHMNDIERFYANKCEIIMQKMDEFQERDSGFALTKINHLDVNINKYACIKGSQYISLPTYISKKKACVNIKNNDVYCFKWAIISALYPIENNSTICSSYNITNIQDDIIVLENNILLNFKNLNFPLSVNKIQQFEDNNPGISINVFGLERSFEKKKKTSILEKDTYLEVYNVVGPYYFSQEEKSKHINLLLMEDEERFHYVWIKNMSRYVYRYLNLYSK